MSRFHRRPARVAGIVLLTAALAALAPSTSSMASPVPAPPASVASAPARVGGWSTLPAACVGGISLIRTDSALLMGDVDASGPWLTPFGDTGLTGPTAAWTYSGFQYDGSAGGDPFSDYLAIGADGLLWDVMVTDTFAAGSEQMLGAGAGWGSVRSLTWAGRTTIVYGLRGNALVRYGFGANSSGIYVSSSRVIASSGWGGVRKIASGGTATVGGRAVDTLYVITTAGALNLYTVDRATNVLLGYPLRTTGWQNVTQLNAERCDANAGVTLVGVMNGSAYLYRDPVSDAKGDIISYGLITKGMTGVLIS